jgi:hypothetical protein
VYATPLSINALFSSLNKKIIVKYLLLFLLSLFSYLIFFAQSPDIQWQKTFGGTGNDQGRSIQLTADGGYIINGFTNSTDGDVSGNHGGNDIWVVKLKSQALSVEITAFKAQNTEGGNLLTWQTASEINTSHFDIERSTDGKLFEKIGELKAQNKPTNYNYLDKSPSGGWGGIIA